jgi:hypothetical protein
MDCSFKVKAHALFQQKALKNNQNTLEKKTLEAIVNMVLVVTTWR